MPGQFLTPEQIAHLGTFLTIVRRLSSFMATKPSTKARHCFPCYVIFMPAFG
jgi:hypothetical protein